MLKDGKYAAWFRTSLGQGTGIVHLDKGRISGGDAYFSYCGSYQVEQEHFTATLTTRRYADGAPTVFGPDELEIKVSGVCNGSMATCSGAAIQAPGVPFEATLIYSQEEVPMAEPKRAVVKLDAGKLPKSPDGRHPFRAGPPGLKGS